MNLTRKEMSILSTIIDGNGEFVSTDTILAAGWPDEYRNGDADPVWVKPHIARIRRKVLLGIKAGYGGRGYRIVR